MGRIHVLEKDGDDIYPVTVTDAIFDPDSGMPLNEFTEAMKNEIRSFLRSITGIPEVFGYRYVKGDPDDRVEAVNDLPYDGTYNAPAGSKRKTLLDKIRPYQCNHDGSNREYLQDDVSLKIGYSQSDLTNPLKLQMARLPDFYYRSFDLDGYSYVLFCEQAPEEILPFSVATQWKKIDQCGYPRYRGIRKQIDGVWKLLSFSGENPSAAVSLILFQQAAKNTNPNATVVPYFIYEALAFLMVLELGRHNVQVAYSGITNADTSYTNAAVTGVTDTLTTPSGEVEVEYEEGKLTKQFRWRFIEGVYGQIWNFLTGIYYVYDAELDVNKVYITRDYGKINTSSNVSDYIHIGNTPAVNGWVKEFIPGSIICEELGGSSTTYKSDYNYTNNSAATRVALVGGTSIIGGSAGLFCFSSNPAASHANASIGASLVLPEITE